MSSVTGYMADKETTCTVIVLHRQCVGGLFRLLTKRTSTDSVSELADKVFIVQHQHETAVGNLQSCTCYCHFRVIFSGKKINLAECVNDFILWSSWA